MSKRFAVFDIDGTIMRWQFLHAMMDVFAEHGYVDKADFQKILDARATWKQRSLTYIEYERTLTRIFEAMFTKIPPKHFDEIAMEVFESYKDETYIYTRDLLRELKSQSYMLLTVTGAPEEVTKHFAKYYDFDDFAATIHHRKNGAFTGKITIPAFDKRKALQALLDKHSLPLAGSIGVGDSASDIAMLEMVEQPIAFNPDEKLFEEAKARGWKIVVERKKVVYELENHDGQIVLA